MKDLSTLLFKVESPKVQPHAGQVLVAEPFFGSEHFNHGVVSVIDYLASEGTTGVVLNNRTEYMLDDLLDGVPNDCGIPVFCGGPVGQDRLFFIHTLGPGIIPNARLYSDGLYVGGDFTQAIEYIKSGYPVDGCIRFFVGYTMWSVGMLENEILDNKWASVSESTPPDLLLTGAGDRFWHRTVRSLGPQYRSWNLLPRNITCN